MKNHPLQLALLEPVPFRAERLLHSVVLDHGLPQSILKRVTWSFREEGTSSFIYFKVDSNPIIISRIVPGSDDASVIDKMSKFVARSIVTYCFIYLPPGSAVADPDAGLPTDHE